MFIVYNPEGHSVVANAQNLPMIKVDPATRINQVTDSELKQLDVDQRLANKQSNLAKQLSAYHKNQESAPKRYVVKVVEVMSKPVQTIEYKNFLSEAFERMNQDRIDYLPVLRNGALIGMLDRQSVLKRLIVDESNKIEQGGSEKVQKVMVQQIVATAFDTDIRHVAQVFTDYDVGAIVITDVNEHLIGIVTQGDLVKRLAKEPPIELYV